MDVKKTTCCSGKSFFGANIGVAGLEPAASWSRTKHSTKLSHTPFQNANILYYFCKGMSRVLKWISVEAVIKIAGKHGGKVDELIGQADDRKSGGLAEKRILAHREKSQVKGGSVFCV